ncbi:MAG TPA: hypothetical protein VGV41_17900 [Pseudolabrys sp.]|uniref:hypothetical protein n=1 Tax=Pseudolabrys sp. TaxID=1960880 RepID=UPI002DDCD4C9|nr:hypothetical protein [Pseudolabrys sp.]HEV2630505.1 hypothetical protein [Pseudolabrys sp.]
MKDLTATRGLVVKVRDLLILDDEGELVPRPDGPLPPETRLEDLVTFGPEPSPTRRNDETQSDEILNQLVVVPPAEAHERNRRRAAGDTLGRLEVGLNTLQAELKAKEGPKFSQAADDYIRLLQETDGEDAAVEIAYLRHRRDVFLQLMEDKPVNTYTKRDLQIFVNEIRHLPAHYARQKDYDVSKIREYIKEEKRRRDAGEPKTATLAQSSIKDNYLTRIKTILKEGCEQAGIPYPLMNVSIKIPKDAPVPRQQIPPDFETLNRIFVFAKRTGVLADIMLPLLGFLTGRRLSILVSMRGERILRYHDNWVVVPENVIVEDGNSIKIGYKTEQSLQFYVLHEFLDRMGFVEWARKQEGFVFVQLNQVDDPARAASKRMGRLFKAAGAETVLLQTFHSLRHAKRLEDSRNKVNPSASRRQAGRKPSDQHDEYGAGVFSQADVEELAKAPLPKEIDWAGLFYNLPFDELAKGDRWPRDLTPKKK